MATTFVKDMGNLESVNQSENDASSADTGDSRRTQERAITGMDKSDQNHSKLFKYDTGVNMKGPSQFPKSVDSRKPVSDGQTQPSQMISHPSYINQDGTSGKEFLPNYPNLQQPMFAPGYANGSSAFTGGMIPPMLVQQPMQVPTNIPGMFQTGFMYQALPESKSSYPKAHYFPPFTKGSLIMLSNGGLKPIEDLKTSDFIESAKISKQLCLETCKIAKIQEVPNSTITLIGFAVDAYEKEVLVEKPSDHPFYVYDQGWASCKPDVTLAQYGLPCQQLRVGDVCVFLSDRLDTRSDKLTGLETKSTTDDVVGIKQQSFGEPNNFSTSQTANGKDLLRDGQLNGNKTASETSFKKSSPFQNVEKSDETSFGPPVGKKAKLDIMAGKNIQDAVKN